MSILRASLNNPVASNMLMVLILGGGLVASMVIPREVFPEFELDRISVSVPYPGASPEDIERSICQKVEDYLTGLEGVKEITSTSREGLGTVVLELYTDADVGRVLDDVKNEIDKIDFPLEAEDPIIQEITLKRHVIHVAVAGEAPERTRKEIAEEVRDELNELPEISQVSVSGVRPYEITVEVSERSLRRHGLTMADVAEAIGSSSFDLPAGDLETPGGELTIRVVGEKLRAEQYRSIPVLSRADGTIVRLSEVATVREGFEDLDIGGQFNGLPAALVSVYKTRDEDTIEITRAVRAYVAAKGPQLPEGITLETWSDRSQIVQDRLDMLVRNGAQGLVLVFLVLWLFLRLRLSLWVALGIPVSILGTVMVIYLTGGTLNMMSMFALIMALGLIVDDAIVVGENVYSRMESGDAPLLAAERGTRAVMLPVIGAVSTTWLAFLPLMFIEGIMGRFIEILPQAVIVALAFSLLECLVILPPHLGHGLRPDRYGTGGPPAGLRGLGPRLRRRLDGAIQHFIHVQFRRLYRLAVRYRYVTVAVVLAVLVITAGAFAGGRIRVVGFPKLDSDTLQAQLVLQTGTPRERTEEVARRITAAALELNGQFETESGEPVVQRVYALIGQQAGPGGESGGHVADVIVELLPAERRGERLPSSEIEKQWRENTGRVSDAQSLRFSGLRGGPRGKALEIRVLGESTAQIQPLADRLRERLGRLAGVSDIEDDAQPGKMEMKIRPRPGAENLGVTLRLLARQLRDRFYGNESLKVQRGRDEVKVMVRYPEEQRRSLGDVETLRVRTADGAEVPFGEVADVTFQRGYTTLRRVDGKSVITVSAEVDEDLANAEQILQQLRREGFFAELTSSVAGSKIDLRGQRQQIFESLNALYVWYPVALLGIYTILAGVFRSYVQPVIIMIAIPFGLVGAAVGHGLLGFEISLMSLFGMVALTGIVVNDSLVLIDRINENVRGGTALAEAAEEGAVRRFRPILLTTVTTVAGMGPLLLERSFQAQFLKPMVISIASGLLFATALTLLVVPSLYLIGNDLKRVLHWLRRGEWVEPDAVISVENRLEDPAEQTDG
jgi:multidrug efflux pump subunit AcrB